MKKTELEKIVTKHKDKDFEQIEIKANAKEREFIEMYLNNGNAYACVLEIWPERKENTNYARVVASKLLKKFSLKGKDREWKNRMLNSLKSSTGTGIVNHVKDMYLAGEITESELFGRMARMSEKAASDNTRFVATKELRQWLKEAQSEVEANKLSMMDIVPLMTSALADLPKDKYRAVLRGCRRKRQELIAEKMIIFDAEKIREEEKQKIIKSGARYDFNSSGGSV